MSTKAYHGGAFFHAIGTDFSAMEKAKSIVNADVLDAWFDPSSRVTKKIQKYLAYIIKTSPPTQSEGLIRTISKYRGIPSKNIAVGGGSSDLMFSYFPQSLKKNDRVLILDPMYGEYIHILNYVVRAKVILHKLNKKTNFRINLSELVGQIKLRHPKMVILVNPNSPTGQYLEKHEIKELLESVSSNITVVIDETYIDFLGDGKSMEKEIINYPNAVIIKSMSKAYALSGARVGYMVANSKIIKKISAFIPPWSVGLVGQIAGVEALKDRAYYRKRYKLTNILRQKMIKRLSKVKNIKVYTSGANFILFELQRKHLQAKKIIASLTRENIFLRNCDSMSNQFYGKFIRIAVKDTKTNAVVISALKKILEK